MNEVASERDFQTCEDHCKVTARREKWRRTAVRVFVLAAAVVMVLSAAPPSSIYLVRSTPALTAMLDRIGLWQGSWSMFAPDPVLNNGWFTAEIQHVDGTQTQWSSPYWSEAGSSDKFWRFRYLNYFNRLPDSFNRSAREDLADYLARQSKVPAESVKLYHTRMKLVLPDDGTLPKRDDVVWIFSSEPVAQRTYSHTASVPSYLPSHIPQP